MGIFPTLSHHGATYIFASTKLSIKIMIFSRSLRFYFCVKSICGCYCQNDYHILKQAVRIISH
jgi:hypothetical protein